MSDVQEPARGPRTPAWVWLVMFGLACTQPLLHAWIAYAPPPGTVPTGLHIADSALFLHSMRMGSHGLTSPYATCNSPYGTHGAIFFAVPHLWLYGALGVLADLMRANHFLFCGLANGVGAFLYLWAAYRFLREAAARQADLAFLLFALSGGLGGILYIVTAFLGLHSEPQFDDVFRRYAVYELFEGPHLLPTLLFPRFYYTCSLALCLGALTAFMKGCRTGRRRYAVATWLLLLPGAFIDLRYGIFSIGIAGLYAWSQTDRPLHTRTTSAWSFALPVMLAAVPATTILRLNPAIVENHFEVTNMAMWFSPFITVALFHLFLLPGELRVRLQTMPLPARVAASTAIGYLLAFTALFCGYQVYYGNIWVARDAAVATAISDYALVGAGLGAFRGLATYNPGPEKESSDWTVLWLLIYLCVALSAFGQGWLLRFGPQRIEVFLWLPLCILSAAALQRLRAAEPGATRTLTAIMVGCGLCSIAVSVLCFQGPLGYHARVSPYAARHAEVMTRADAHMMDRVGAGTVLAPIPASDILTLRRENRTVFGTGSFNLSDQPYRTLQTQVAEFFSPHASDDFRSAFVKEWCVDYIYCPDTWPVDSDLVAQLRRTFWLEEVASEGRAAVFRVRGEPIVVAQFRVENTRGRHSAYGGT